jgi:osmotically inducible protein OsmC
MDILRSASAVWRGDMLTGVGQTSTASGAVQNVAMSHSKRFGEDHGSNPEELIAAAHASCFSMAFSGRLTRAGFPPEEIKTTATVTLQKGETGFSITAVHLDTVATVPGIDEATFAEAAEGAKDGCPVSRLLAPGLQSLTLDARLVA